MVLLTKYGAQIIITPTYIGKILRGGELPATPLTTHEAHLQLLEQFGRCAFKRHGAVRVPTMMHIGSTGTITVYEDSTGTTTVPFIIFCDTKK